MIGGKRRRREEDEREEGRREDAGALWELIIFVRIIPNVMNN